MLDLPAPVLQYLYISTLATRSPAYLFVRKDGRLSRWEGKLDAYGIGGLRKGGNVGEQIFFLEGLLPLEDAPVSLSCVKTPAGRWADVHMIPGEDGDWVLFLDASAEEAQRRLLQQKTNDLALLRQLQPARWTQHLEKGATAELSRQPLPFREKGERKAASIVVATLQEFTAYSETDAPPVVVRTLNTYFRALVQPILREGGLVQTIMGDLLLAVFGVLPSTSPSPGQATMAAFLMIEAVRRIHRTRRGSARATFELGIGITSGPVVIGLIDGKERNHVGLCGGGLERAVSLARRARPGEILVDELTFENLENMQDGFTTTLPILAHGEADPLQAYSSMVRSQ